MRQLAIDAPSGKTNIFLGTSLPNLKDIIRSPTDLVITDSNVNHFYPNQFAGEENTIVLPAGELAKEMEHVLESCRRLHSIGADRNSRVIAFGGGAITDVAGFVAAIFLRGVDLISVPTTLLAKVDASVGGKNGINFENTKNQIGTTRHAKACYCDLTFLRTLPDVEFRSGMAEVIKAAAICDASFFNFLEDNIQQIMARDPAVLEAVIARAIEIKIDVVDQDEFETGRRKILNFGHTIGHAIERINHMSHGYAISVGMMLAIQLSVDLGFSTVDDKLRLGRLLKAFGLPTEAALAKDEIMQLIGSDKKRANGKIGMVLLKGIGLSEVMPLDFSVVAEFLDSVKHGKN